MNKILVLGAGHSTPYLIRHLLDRSADLDLRVAVADLDRAAAEARIAGHPRGRALALDIGDAEACARQLADTRLVVNLLPATLQPLVARRCVEHRCHMVSASYRSAAVTALGAEAAKRGVALLCEMGLDPGMDLMSAQRLIEDIRARGGVIDRFLSYGGGLPEPAFAGNPLRYCVTWNPRNVAMAAEHGAQFLRRGRIRLQPWPRVFEGAWSVDVPGLGTMEAYANRDSIAYRSIHGIERVRTLLRGTLRYPGFCALWQLIVRLGLPNEHMEIPRLGQRTWAELVAMFLPEATADGDLRQRLAGHLEVAADDPRLDTFEYLCLFSDEPIDVAGNHPTDALVALLGRRLPLPPEHRDLVVLHHEIDALFGERVERTLSTFVHYGEAGGTTAMATTVGLPAALGACLLLEGRIDRRGCLGPTDPDVYGPVLADLEASGLRFEESTHVPGEAPAPSA